MKLDDAKVVIKADIYVVVRPAYTDGPWSYHETLAGALEAAATCSMLGADAWVAKVTHKTVPAYQLQRVKE